MEAKMQVYIMPVSLLIRMVPMLWELSEPMHNRKRAKCIGIKKLWAQAKLPCKADGHPTILPFS